MEARTRPKLRGITASLPGRSRSRAARLAARADVARARRAARWRRLRDRYGDGWALGAAFLAVVTFKGIPARVPDWLSGPNSAITYWPIQVGQLIEAIC